MHGFRRKQQALRDRYALALHTDESHPHLHVIIQATGEQGESRNIRKAKLKLRKSGKIMRQKSVDLG